MWIMLIMFIQMSFHFSYSTLSFQCVTILHLKIKLKRKIHLDINKEIYFSSDVLSFRKELTKASVLAITHAQNKSAASRKRTSVEP